MLSVFQSSYVFSVIKISIFICLFIIFGFIFSMIAYISGYFIVQYLVDYLFKWQAVGLGDLLFIETNIANDFVSVGGFYLEKINPKGMKEKLIERGVKKIQKLRQVPFPFLNNWYFHELPMEIALAKANENIKLISDKRLKDPVNYRQYAFTEMQKLFPKQNELMWEFHIIDFEDEEGGLFLLKMDHLMSDATGLINIYALLIDNFEAMKYPAVSVKKTLWNDIKYYIKIPYYIAYSAYIYTKEIYSNTLFRDNKPIVPNKKRQISFFSTRIHDFKVFYNKTKELKVTFNDLILILFSKSLKKYYKDKGFTKNNLSVGVTVGPQTMPSDKSKIVVRNASTCVLVNVKFIDDIYKEAEMVGRKIGETTRDKDYSRCLLWMVNYMNLVLPRSFSRLITQIAGTAIDFMLSNIPGPKENIFIDGCKVLNTLAFPPLGYSKAFCVVATYAGRFALEMSLDKTLNIDEKELKTIIENEIEELISPTK